jgi:hypothetical protein
MRPSWYGALLGVLLAAGCVLQPQIIAAQLDPTGTWATAPDDADDAGGGHRFRAARLVVDTRYVLDPLGSDCAGTPTYAFQPPVMFVDLLALHQWPASWIGSLAGGTDPVQEVLVNCAERPILRLVLLTPSRALMPLDDGSVLVLYKTRLRS